jgi:hypothetical protein
VQAGTFVDFEPCCISETCLYPSFEVTKTLLLTIWVLQGLLSPLHRWQLAASWWASAWVPQL